MTMGKLFGADGIRGLVNQHPLVAEDLERLGRVLGTVLGQRETRPKVLLARDTRESCLTLARPFVFGLRQSGVSITDIGVLPTPGVSYLTRRFDYTAGMMISASHNPITENGIKLFDQLGHKLSEAQEAEIEALYFSSAPLKIDPHWGAVETDPRLGQHYADSLAAECSQVDWSNVPVIVDCAQGASSDIMARMVAKLAVPAILLNANPDGTNANAASGTEHVRRYPSSLAKLLRQQGWQVGIAFDGDADRVLFVDQAGKVYDGDSVLVMLAFSLQGARRLPGNMLATTPARNTGLRDHLRRSGISVIETQRSGDKYVVDLMEQRGVVLGGEQVGHLIVLDECHVTGDGIRTAWMVLKLLAERPGIVLDDLTGGLRKYPQVWGGAEIPRPAHRADLESIPGLADLERQAQAALPGLLRFEVRFASTEPLLRIMFESDGGSSVQELARWARRIGAHVQSALGYAGYSLEVLDNTRGGLIVEE